MMRIIDWLSSAYSLMGIESEAQACSLTRSRATTFCFIGQCPSTEEEHRLGCSLSFPRLNCKKKKKLCPLSCSSNLKCSFIVNRAVVVIEIVNNYHLLIAQHHTRMVKWFYCSECHAIKMIQTSMK